MRCGRDGKSPLKASFSLWRNFPPQIIFSVPHFSSSREIVEKLRWSLQMCDSKLAIHLIHARPKLFAKLRRVEEERKESFRDEEKYPRRSSKWQFFSNRTMRRRKVFAIELRKSRYCNTFEELRSRVNSERAG